MKRRSRQDQDTPKTGTRAAQNGISRRTVLKAGASAGVAAALGGAAGWMATSARRVTADPPQAPKGPARVRIRRLDSGPPEIRRVRLACQINQAPGALVMTVEDGGARLADLIDGENTASDIWADTAYRSEKNEAMLAARGLVSRIHRKKPKGKPMAAQTRRAS